MKFIVRVETGTINRGVYRIAFLHQPGQPLPDPWTEIPGWNGRLVYSFGGGCRTGFRQGTDAGAAGSRPRSPRVTPWQVHPGRVREQCQRRHQRRNADDGEGALRQEFRRPRAYDRVRRFRRLDSAVPDRAELSGPARRHHTRLEFCRSYLGRGTDTGLRADRARGQRDESRADPRAAAGGRRASVRGAYAKAATRAPRNGCRRPPATPPCRRTRSTIR